MTHQRASARLDPGTARPFRGFKIDGVAAPSRGAGTLFLPPGPTIKQAGLLSRTTRLTAGALSPANVLCLRGTLPGVAQPGSRAVAPRFISVRCPFRRCVHVSPARSCSPYRPLGLFGDAWTWLLLCVCAAAGQVRNWLHCQNGCSSDCYLSVHRKVATASPRIGRMPCAA